MSSVTPEPSEDGANGESVLQPVTGYTVDETAQLLRISKSQVNKLIYGRKMRSYRCAGRRFIDDAAIAEYIEKSKKDSGYY